MSETSDANSTIESDETTAILGHSLSEFLDSEDSSPLSQNIFGGIKGAASSLSNSLLSDEGSKGDASRGVLSQHFENLEVPGDEEIWMYDSAQSVANVTVATVNMPSSSPRKEFVDDLSDDNIIVPPSPTLVSKEAVCLGITENKEIEEHFDEEQDHTDNTSEEMLVEPENCSLENEDEKISGQVIEVENTEDEEERSESEAQNKYIVEENSEPEAMERSFVMENRLEEQCSGDHDVSLVLEVPPTKFAVDEQVQTDIIADNASKEMDISGYLNKFLDSAFRVTPQGSHRVILHNTISLAFFIKSQIAATGDKSTLEQACELIKEIESLQGRL